MNVNNALFSAEQVIDRSIIRSGEGHGGEEKQERFRKTAMAMQEIISKKLYKAKHSTMEQYFKEVFKLSRASVYRFVDASRVLNQLEGFHILPFGERQCRTLRRCTKDLQTIRLLWSTVLNKYGEDPSLITSTIIQNTWDEMIEKKLVDPSKISIIKSNNSGDKNNNKNKKDVKITQNSTVNNPINNSVKSIQGVNNMSKLTIPTSGSMSNISDLSNMNMNQKFIPSYSSTATLVDSSNNNTLSDIAGLQIDDTGASIYTITNCNNQSYSATSQTQSPLNKNKNVNYGNFTSSLQSNSTLVATTPTSTAISMSHTNNNVSPSTMNINSSSMTNINPVGSNNPLSENYISSNVINSNTSLNTLGYSIANQQNFIATPNTNFPASSLATSSRLTPNFQRRISNNSPSNVPTIDTYYQAYQYTNTTDISSATPESYVNMNTDHFINNINSSYPSQLNNYMNFNNYNPNSYFAQSTSQNSQYNGNYSNYSPAPTSSYFSSSDIPYNWYGNGNERTNNGSSKKYFPPSTYYSQLRMINPNSDDIRSYSNSRVISNNYSLNYNMDSLNNIDNQNNSNGNVNSRNVNISSEDNRLNNNNYSLNNYPYTVIGIVNSQNNIIQ